MSNRTRHSTSVSLDPQLVKKLKEMAKENQRTFSMQVEKLLEKALILESY